MHEGRLDQGTAGSSLGVCVRRWYKCGVNLASNLLLPFFAELDTQNFTPNTKALADIKRLMSFIGLQCGHPAGGIRRLQRTQAPRCLDLLPIPREAGRCSRVFWCDTAFSCSSNDCLSEEKTSSSLKSQDRVRALLIVCGRLECSKLGRLLSQL